MKKLTHALVHVGLTILQVGNAAHQFIPFPGNVIAAGGLGVVQGIIALKNHKRNESIEY